MNRRGFFQLLASIPFVGVLSPKDDDIWPCECVYAEWDIGEDNFIEATHALSPEECPPLSPVAWVTFGTSGGLWQTIPIDKFDEASLNVPCVTKEEHDEFTIEWGKAPKEWFREIKS